MLALWAGCMALDQKQCKFLWQVVFLAAEIEDGLSIAPARYAIADTRGTRPAHLGELQQSQEATMQLLLHKFSYIVHSGDVMARVER